MEGRKIHFVLKQRKVHKLLYPMGYSCLKLQVSSYLLWKVGVRWKIILKMLSCSASAGYGFSRIYEYEASITTSHHCYNLPHHELHHFNYRLGMTSSYYVPYFDDWCHLRSWSHEWWNLVYLMLFWMEFDWVWCPCCFDEIICYMCFDEIVCVTSA